MRSHFQSKLLPLLLLMVSISTYASSPNFIFRMDAGHDAPEFTPTDAITLTKFLVQEFDVAFCNEISLEVIVNTNYGQKNMVESLYNQGYIVLNLGCEQEKIVFTLSKPVHIREVNWILYSDSETGNDEEDSNYYNENNLWLDEEATAKAFSNSEDTNPNW